jgi:hypothetical protein
MTTHLELCDSGRAKGETSILVRFSILNVPGKKKTLKKPEK